jgi:hypothetical protein
MTLKRGAGVELDVITTSSGYRGGGRPFDLMRPQTKLIDLTYQNSAFYPHSVSVCSLWFSQYTATVSPNSVNRLGFVVEM